MFFKEVFYIQFVFVFYIYIIYVIPKFLVDSSRFHHIPAIRIRYSLGNLACSRRTAFHFLFDIGRIQNRCAAFYTDCFFKFLHFHVVTVPVVAKISVRVFTGNIAYGKIHTSHKFIYVVEAQCSPSVTLTGLNDNICTVQCCFKGKFLKDFPVFFVTVEGSHIVEVSICNFRFTFPTVAGFHHSLNSCTIHAISTSEYSERSHFAGIFRTDTFFGQHSFSFYHTGGYLIFKLVVFRCRSHFYCTVNQEEAGSGDITELSGSLNYYVDTWTSQFG